MIKQLVNIVEFPQLYNILSELKNLFSFKVINFLDYSDFVTTENFDKNIKYNTIIIVNKKNHDTFFKKYRGENTIQVFEDLPIKLEELLDKINIQLIKQEYTLQSSITIKSYTLDLNRRVIVSNITELKLTEREIDIILFLNNCNAPQSIDTLQTKVWRHSFNLETHTVETHIYRLKKKFFDKFNDNNFIISLKTGYKI